MPLVIYNTRTRRKQEFEPLREGEVRMYVCGITAYDSCHIGHARSAVVFDVATRYLRWLGYAVTFVRNFTDVDDKIILRSLAENTPAADIAQRYMREYEEDMEALGVARPEHQPTVTEHMDDIIALIQRLVDTGYAYAGNGDVYFAVDKFPNYGALSGRQLDEMISGARVEPGEAKVNPLDFALWKQAKPNEPSWESPWGPGRPGWHIECSAMSQSYLGSSFDIHGGGKDLLFPHHENEIAQSQAATGDSFVNVWMHNGFVNINHEKMSKSLGNFMTIRDILKQYHPEVIRLFLISTHYRSPVDYTMEAMQTAKKNLDYFYALLQRLDETAATSAQGRHGDGGEGEAERLRHAVRQAMDNDFNTAAALAALFDVGNALHSLLDHANLAPASAASAAAAMRQVGSVLGLFGVAPHDFLRWRPAANSTDVDDAWVEEQIEQRDQARRNKNFAEGDRIREELQALGIILEDGKEGTRWRRS